MKALEYQNGSLELQPLPDCKPVELTEHWRDMVELTGSSNKASSGILKILQLVQQPSADSNKKLVTVVDSTANKCIYQCLRCRWCQEYSCDVPFPAFDRK